MNRPTKIYIFGFTTENKEKAINFINSGKFEAIYLCTKAGKIKQVITASIFGNGLVETINY